MAQADFYILDHDDTQARYKFICRLIEKVYQKGRKIFVYAADEKEANTIDEILWTFEPESFVPHVLDGEGANTPPRVVIGFDNLKTQHNDVLINLNPNVNDSTVKYKRILEIICNNENSKSVAREHYGFYREKGFKLSHHEVQ